MRQFKPRIAVLQATRWNGIDMPADLAAIARGDRWDIHGKNIELLTEGGWATVCPGDWIVREGDRWFPMTDQTFNRLYEEIT